MLWFNLKHRNKKIQLEKTNIFSIFEAAHHGKLQPYPRF